MANEFVAKNGLISQNNTIVSGSLTVTQGITGSLQGTASWANNATTASYISSSNIIGTVTSASYALTASYAMNGGSGDGGAGANITASFTNQSIWTFNHALNNQGVVIQTFDSSWNQTIPQNITLTNANTATIAFTSAKSGYAIASLGGVAVVANTNAVFAQTASYAYTASYALTASTVPTYEGAWTSYTPVWTTDGVTQPVIGNGTLTGAYKQIGKTVFVRVKLNAGTTTTFGAGSFQFSLPVTASNADGIQFPCSMLDNGVHWYQGTVNGTYTGATYKSAIIYNNTSGWADSVTSTAPFTWGSTDSLQFNGSYEAA